MLIQVDENIEILDKIDSKSLQRGVDYGDGIFETLIQVDITIRFWNDHIERLNKGLGALEIELVNEEEKEKLKKLILNHHTFKKARIKIYVWRQEGGIFKPLSSKKHIGFNIIDFSYFRHETKSKVSFSNQITNSKNPLSPYKTLSSANYVIAGLEAKKRDLEDLIILDPSGNISECLTSSIYWVKSNVVHTPHLDSGCILGIAKTQIKALCEKTGYQFKEVLAQQDELIKADFIFTSNVASLNIIESIDDINFDTKHHIFDLIKKELY